MLLHMFKECHLEGKMERVRVLGSADMVGWTTSHGAVAAVQHGDVGEERLVFDVLLREKFVHRHDSGLRPMTVELRDVRQVMVMVLQLLLVIVLRGHCQDGDYKHCTAQSTHDCSTLTGVWPLGYYIVKKDTRKEGDPPNRSIADDLVFPRRLTFPGMYLSLQLADTR